MTQQVQLQVILPLRKAIKIAWRNIRVRWFRSLLVTSGIILALAFLMYVLSSDAISRSVSERSDAAWRARLSKAGLITAADSAQSRTQTWWLVGLALMVSFVGILNAMLMSVTERFAEIGTMKCLGALDGFIIKLFLLESVFQGLSGTALGICIGLALAVLEGVFTYGGKTLTVLPGIDLVQFVGICALAGVVLTVCGALYPAWRAAKMQPVEAMRAEV